MVNRNSEHHLSPYHLLCNKPIHLLKFQEIFIKPDIENLAQIKTTSQMPWTSYTKKVIDFNGTFSSVVVPKILIKYLLHACHDSLGHVRATKLYHFHTKVLLLPRHVEVGTPIC